MELKPTTPYLLNAANFELWAKSSMKSFIAKYYLVYFMYNSQVMNTKLSLLITLFM